MTDKIQAVPEKLPAVLEDWVSHLKAKRTINDLVEDIHKLLISSKEGESYLAYLNAVYDEQAVEGSLSADNVFAAKMIRDRAEKIDGHPLQKEKVATISKALGIVLRRYHLSRKERRQIVDGKAVDGDNGD